MSRDDRWDAVPSLDDQLLTLLEAVFPLVLKLDAAFLWGLMLLQRAEAHARLRAHEGERFDHAVGGRRQQASALRTALVHRLDRRRSELERRRKAYEAKDTHITIADPSPTKPPRTLVSWMTLAMSLAAMVALPFAAFFSQYTVLESDGRIRGARGFAYAAIVLFCPLLIHGALELFASDATRRRYARVVIFSAIFLMPLWIAGFVFSFGDALSANALILSDYSPEVLSSADSGWTALATKLFLFGTVLLEALTAAGAFLLFQHAWKAHSNTGTEVPCPDSISRGKEVAASEDAVGADAALLARLDAFIAMMNAAREQHIGTAIASFDRLHDGFDDLGLLGGATPVKPDRKGPPSLNGAAKPSTHH